MIMSFCVSVAKTIIERIIIHSPLRSNLHFSIFQTVKAQQQTITGVMNYKRQKRELCFVFCSWNGFICLLQMLEAYVFFYQVAFVFTPFATEWNCAGANEKGIVHFCFYTPDEFHSKMTMQINLWQKDADISLGQGVGGQCSTFYIVQISLARKHSHLFIPR